MPITFFLTCYASMFRVSVPLLHHAYATDWKPIICCCLPRHHSLIKSDVGLLPVCILKRKSQVYGPVPDQRVRTTAQKMCKLHLCCAARCTTMSMKCVSWSSDMAVNRSLSRAVYCYCCCCCWWWCSELNAASHQRSDGACSGGGAGAGCAIDEMLIRLRRRRRELSIAYRRRVGLAADMQ